MFRFILLIVCLAWASLLLISWGGPIDQISPTEANAAVTAQSQGL